MAVEVELGAGRLSGLAAASHRACWSRLSEAGGPLEAASANQWKREAGIVFLMARRLDNWSRFLGRNRMQRNVTQKTLHIGWYTSTKR